MKTKTRVFIRQPNLGDGEWPKNQRLTVDVLIRNIAAIAFWRSVGYKDYCLTLEIISNK